MQWRSQDFGSGGINFLSRVGLLQGVWGRQPPDGDDLKKNFMRMYWKYQNFKKFLKFLTYFYIPCAYFSRFWAKNKIFEKIIGIFENFHRKYQIFMEIWKFKAKIYIPCDEFSRVWAKNQYFDKFLENFENFWLKLIDLFKVQINESNKRITYR